MPRWRPAQFGDVVDRFKPDCPEEAWGDILFRYSVLIEKGPMCGTLVAKKLVNGKGIWELLGHANNAQPRLLFYFDEPRQLVVFVYAFLKKGNNQYKHAIEIAQKRRRLIERSERQTNVITAFTQVH